MLVSSEVEESRINVVGAFSEDMDELRKQINEYLEKLDQQTLINVVNSDEPIEEKVSEEWLIEHNFETRTRTGLEYTLASILNKTIRINTCEEFAE